MRKERKRENRGRSPKGETVGSNDDGMVTSCLGHFVKSVTKLCAGDLQLSLQPCQASYPTKCGAALHVHIKRQSIFATTIV